MVFIEFAVLCVNGSFVLEPSDRLSNLPPLLPPSNRIPKLLPANRVHLISVLARG